ncbi:MAG: hypothetical protein GX113_10180 [Actinobacteria bacterium]|jgi:flavodoxin|nr:hypothetical protein [Actinomycetota bacterium]
MKGLVIYYSATEGTKKIARAIHRGMSGVIETTDVRLFMHRLPRLDGKSGFGSCSHGTTPPRHLPLHGAVPTT